MIKGHGKGSFAIPKLAFLLPKPRSKLSSSPKSTSLYSSLSLNPMPYGSLNRYLTYI